VSIATAINPYLAYIKIGAAVIVLCVVSTASFHFGGLSADNKLANYKTSVQAQYAANLKTVADTLNQQIQDGVADRAAKQRIIDAYDAEKLKPPITAGVVERLRYVESASCAASHQLPQAGTVAGGAAATGGVPPSVSELDRLHQAAFDAADRDSKRLNAAVMLAPKPKPWPQ
jgi:hypothetical protein